MGDTSSKTKHVLVVGSIAGLASCIQLYRHKHYKNRNGKKHTTELDNHVSIVEET